MRMGKIRVIYHLMDFLVTDGKPCDSFCIGF